MNSENLKDLEDLIINFELNGETASRRLTYEAYHRLEVLQTCTQKNGFKTEFFLQKGAFPTNLLAGTISKVIQWILPVISDYLPGYLIDLRKMRLIKMIPGFIGSKLVGLNTAKIPPKSERMVIPVPPEHMADLRIAEKEFDLYLMMPLSIEEIENAKEGEFMDYKIAYLPFEKLKSSQDFEVMMQEKAAELQVKSDQQTAREIYEINKNLLVNYFVESGVQTGTISQAQFKFDIQPHPVQTRIFAACNIVNITSFTK